MRLLVIGYGNPGRGDDGLGPHLLTLLAGCQVDFKRLQPRLTLNFITDFQLSIELVLDIQSYQFVLFIDAHYPATMTQPSGYALQPVQPAIPDRYSTHYLTPAHLLAIYQQVLKQPPPPAWLFTVEGHDFALGASFSAQARQRLCRAFMVIYWHLQTRLWLF